MALLRRRMRLGGRKQKRFGKVFLTRVLSVLLITALAVGCGILFVSAFMIRTMAVGESMEPVIYNGQSVLIDRVRFKLLSPGRNSVIVFLPNGNTASHYYVKRVVALPGDRVQIMNNDLYVNGALAYVGDDDYDKMEDAGIAENEIRLGNDEYFVLGDNRNASEDSRSANIGPVKKEQIVGAAWFKFGGEEGGAGFVN